MGLKATGGSPQIMARRKNVRLPAWCSGKLPPRQGRDIGRPGLRVCGTWLHLGGILEMSPLSVGSGMPFTSGLGSIQECGGLLLSLLLTPGHSSGVGQGSLLSPCCWHLWEASGNPSLEQLVCIMCSDVPGNLSSGQKVRAGEGDCTLLVFSPGWVLKCPGVSRQEGPARREGSTSRKFSLWAEGLWACGRLGSG